MIFNKLTITLVFVAVIAMTLPAGGSAKGPLRNCPVVCTEELRPVCASLVDGSKQTFSNPCESTKAACLNNLPILSTTPGAC